MDKKYYLIGNAHLDLSWQWRFFDGLSEVLATYRSALDRIKEYDDFNFTCGANGYLEYVKYADKGMFEEIKRRVKEGRWINVGGMYVQPDLNIPSGESLARQTLYAQNFLYANFNKTATVGYNVDSFGQNGNLPQIYKKSGMSNYVFMRPSKQENPDMPKDFPDLFRWKSLDGSEVLTFHISNTYCAWSVQKIRETVNALVGDNPHMVFYGIGNHGGGPTVELIEAVKEMMNTEEGYKLSDVEEYFRVVKDLKTPVVFGEMQYHAPGAYTAVSEIKKLNRKAESELIAAEALCSVSTSLTDFEYNETEIKKLWKKLLFLHFHDVICGCTVKSAAKEAVNIFGGVIADSENASFNAMKAISRNIDTLKGKPYEYYRTQTWFPFMHKKLGSPLVVFNPLPFENEGYVRVYENAAYVLGEKGENIPVQIVRGEQTDGAKHLYNTLIKVKVPAYGYTTVRLFDGEILPPENSNEVDIENDLLKITFDKKSGYLNGVFDKKANVQLLSGVSSVKIINEERADTWAHGEKNLGNVEGEFECTSLKRIETGKLRNTVRGEYKYKDSVMKVNYTLLDGDDALHVATEITMTENRKAVKVCNKFNVNGAVLAENPFAYTPRPDDDREFPMQRYLTVGNLEDGATVCNNSKYGASVCGNEVMITALRTCGYLDHYGTQCGTLDEFTPYADKEPIEFEYTISKNNGIADAVKKACRLNTPLKYVTETFHGGKLYTEFSNLTGVPDNVCVSALKKSHDGKGYVVRAYELEGKAVDADIKFNAPKIEIKANFKPFEIKTFKIEDGCVSEVNIAEFKTE